MGQLEWTDPFHYKIQRLKGVKVAPQDAAMNQMRQFLYTRGCRWQFILRAFGFAAEAEEMGGCGKCDRCVVGRN